MINLKSHAPPRDFEKLYSRVRLIIDQKHKHLEITDEQLRALWLDRPTQQEIDKTPQGAFIAPQIVSIVPAHLRVDLRDSQEIGGIQGEEEDKNNLSWRSIQILGKPIAVHTLSLQIIAPHLFDRHGNMYLAGSEAFEHLDLIDELISAAPRVKTPEEALKIASDPNRMLTWAPIEGQARLWNISDPGSVVEVPRDLPECPHCNGKGGTVVLDRKIDVEGGKPFLTQRRVQCSHCDNTGREITPETLLAITRGEKFSTRYGHTLSNFFSLDGDERCESIEVVIDQWVEAFEEGDRRKLCIYYPYKGGTPEEMARAVVTFIKERAEESEPGSTFSPWAQWDYGEVEGHNLSHNGAAIQGALEMVFERFYNVYKTKTPPLREYREMEVTPALLRGLGYEELAKEVEGQKVLEVEFEKAQEEEE